MKIVLLNFLLAFPFFLRINAQDSVTVQDVRTAYESFQYRSVIQFSETLLLQEKKLSKEDLITIYVMKAVAHFSLSEEEAARQSFVKLLLIQSDYELDPIEISPKIVSFFERIKADVYQVTQQTISPKTEKKDTTILANPQAIDHSSEVKSALTRSLILPGWGHLYLNNGNAGWVLATTSSLSLAASVYLFIDTYSKEKKYLSETEEKKIASAYKLYNTSYKLRNIFLGLYVAEWMYSQVDLLYSSNQMISISFYHSSAEENFPINSTGLNFSFPVLRK